MYNKLQAQTSRQAVPCSTTVAEVESMKPVSVKCQRCNFRLFDVRPESDPRGIISIKCISSGKISDIDIAEYVKNPPPEIDRTKPVKKSD